MTTKYLTPKEVQDNIESISLWVAPAMEYSAGESTLEDILIKLMDGRCLLWMEVNEEDVPINISVTELITMGRKRVCHVITTVGDWQNSRGTHNAVEEYAEAAGCDSLMFWGRSGWARAMSKVVWDSGRKYEHSYTVMEMRL